MLSSNTLRSLKSEAPDVLISTPTKLLVLLEAKSIDLSQLRFLAIDEADLLLSYGHKDDLTRLMDPSTGWMPKLGVQGCLMSATLSEDIEGVKGLVLRNPVCPHFTSVDFSGDRFICIRTYDGVGDSHIIRANSD